jgi:hypothetical protein
MLLTLSFLLAIRPMQMLPALLRLVTRVIYGLSLRGTRRLLPLLTRYIAL